MQLPKPRMPVPRSPDLAEPAAPICPAATRDPQPAPTSLAPTVLLYDWDNTLVDGWAAITAALNAVFAEFAMPAWTAEDTATRVRVSLRESFPADVRRPLGTCARPVLRQPSATSTWTTSSRCRARPRRWPPAPPGRRAWCPTRPAAILRAEVAHLGWAAHFRAVVGAGDAAADKPDPAPIHLALQQLGHRADASVWYLGDTALDMQAARAAGVTAVLIGDAAHDRGIAHAAPDIHFPTAHDLAAHFRALA